MSAEGKLRWSQDCDLSIRKIEMILILSFNGMSYMCCLKTDVRWLMHAVILKHRGCSELLLGWEGGGREFLARGGGVAMSDMQ